MVMEWELNVQTGNTIYTEIIQFGGVITGGGVVNLLP